MSKPLMDKLIKEVGDLGDRMALGLSHTAGGAVVNPGASTYSSPDVSQNPDEFPSDSPESHKYAPKIAGSASNITVKTPDSGIADPEKDISPEDIKNTEKVIDDIKFKVTPDEVMAGINAELKDMVFKRPDVAKALVIKNLRKDPKYYSKLKFLGMDDSMNENRKYMTKQERVIADIIKNMWENKRNKRK